MEYDNNHFIIASRAYSLHGHHAGQGSPVPSRQGRFHASGAATVEYQEQRPEQ
jgi:hypothetical protein